MATNRAEKYGLKSSQAFYQTEPKSVEAKKIEAEAEKVLKLSQTCTSTDVATRLKRQAASIYASAVYLQKEIDAETSKQKKEEELLKDPEKVKALAAKYAALAAKVTEKKE